MSDHDMTSPPSDAEPEARKPRPRLTIAVVVLGALVALTALSTLFVGDVAFLSRFCGSCHEIAPAVEAWRTSTHSKVGCYACHEAAAPLPLRLADRTTRLAREVAFHISGTQADPGRSLDLSVPDASCEGCHNPSRQPSTASVIIDHDTHSRANRSCLSCHMDSTHPKPGADRALLQMQQCYGCHGTASQPDAAAECSTCHPEDFDAQPDSHETGPWVEAHGSASSEDPEQCAMCHVGSYCTDCHAVPMPHPANWLDPESGHASQEATDPMVCAQCHPAQPEPCGTCHHGGHDPSIGPWEEKHGATVQRQGSGLCFDCHDANYCGPCHETEAPWLATP